jgi:hypothetical protein
VLAIGAVATCGCSQTRQYQPPLDPSTLSDIQFVHYLETVPVVTFEEGCRAMLIATEGEDRWNTHEDRYAELKGRGMVRDAWGLQGDDIFDLGTASYMAAEALELKPSASSILLGSWGLGDRRYAVRKAVDAQLITYGPFYKPMTGGATVWAMGRINDHVTGQGVYTQPIKPTGDMDRSSSLAVP